VLFLVGLAYANGASVETCKVGQWSNWSECISSKHCPAEPIPIVSYPMEVTEEWDEGRTGMQTIMKAKLESWAQTRQCMADGSCPELNRLPIAGAYTCNANGIAGDIPCKNVDQLAYMTIPQLGYTPPIQGDSPAGNDCWGWEDPLNGDEYAIVGLTGGTSFVRITDPKNPVAVGFIRTATTYSSWRDIKVIGSYAYIVSEARGHGLQVFDLTKLRGRNTLAVFTPDAVSNVFGNAHNIVANEETHFLYVVGATQAGTGYQLCRGGLLVLDVASPLQPRYAGCFGTDGYVHDAQCVIYHGPHAAYRGRELCFCFNENSLTLVDVHDKNNMRVIAKSGYVNVAYTHQGWLTEDHEVILLDDEQDEYNKPSAQQFTKTYVWDIRVLTQPTLKSVFQSSERSVDHNQYIIGNYAYQGNYESGLRILHINRATYELTSVAYFDAYPSRTTPQFNGIWSVYPFLRSGTIVLSSINHGMFLVKANLSAMDELVKSNTTFAEQTRTRPVLEISSSANCPYLIETKSCEAPVLC